jgi:cob(I)alamin adenosyltransferase
MEGADMLATLMHANVIIDHSSSEGREVDPRLKENEIQRAFVKCSEAALKGKFDIVVFNDIHTILKEGLVLLEDLLSLIDEKPPHVELVLTGPGAPEAVVEKADLVTEMNVQPTDLPCHRERLFGEPGYVDVITGNGKGKTTYCIGKSVLASCLGVRSAILQFIKSPQAYGEVKAIGKFSLMKILSMGEGFLDHHASQHAKKHLDAAHKAWEKCLREIFSLNYGLVVLDEINTATHYGLVNQERILEMCSLKPMNLKLLLSGRHAAPDVMAAADAVIEMREIKHPYKKGIRARKGIEY